MPALLWKGKTSPLLKIVINTNSIIAWMLGNMRDTGEMKRRVRDGYDAVGSDDVLKYDDVGVHHYNYLAKELLAPLDLAEKSVLDVGCGSGFLALAVLARGAGRVVCGDQSERMLDQLRAKAARDKLGKRIECMVMDAENIPFPDNSFDVVVSGMVIGLVPDQARVIAEMKRVCRPGGTVAFSTHGTGLYYEANELCFRTYLLHYPLGLVGYRAEYWPWDEKTAKDMLAGAGLTETRVDRRTWKEDMGSTDAVYDFWAGTTSLYWNGKFSREKAESLAKKVRASFARNDLRSITQDAVLCYGRK
jgi:ubiquinone/menaquinone biosynthesis C-methylase UbiE